MVFAVNISVFAIDITGTAPTISETDHPSISTNLGTTFDEILQDLNELFGFIETEPKNLIQAFANSSVYSSHSAINRSYGEYKLFSVNIGAMAGFQLPLSPFEIMLNGFGDFQQTLIDDGDITLGLSPQMFSAHIGFNTSFLIKNLYLGLRVGFINLPEGSIQIPSISSEMTKPLSVKNTTIGLTVNYQLIPSISLAGLIKWKGINIGSGFVYSNSTLNYSMPLDSVTELLPIGSTGYSLAIDPKIILDLNMSVFTIPLEVFTAIRFLFINIPLGAGVDFAFGKTTMKAGIDSKMYVYDSSDSIIPQIEPGSINADVGGEIAPSFLNLKVMSGIGFVWPPIVIDIPVTWYIKDNGFSIGFTFGITF